MPGRLGLAALTLALCAAAACGPDDPPAPGSSDAGKPFRVALLTPGSVADGGWNQGAYDGLRRIERELGAQVSHVETKTPAEFEEGFRDYASRGYDLVFGHGFEYQEAAAKVAAEFPRTVFVTTSGSTVRENLAPMVFELEQATYLCGLLAARQSRTGVVGMIGGIRLPSIESTFLAFRAGVERTRPGAQVRESWIGNFDDTAAAREASLALLEEGADFLIHQANDAGRGVFQAVSERAAAGEPVYAFGTNRDQSAMAPDVVMASATLDLPGAFVFVARQVREGRFEARPLHLGMKEGVVAFVWNPALEARVPEAVRRELRETEARIRSGELAVPRGNF
jgi:basic membrane lipoprotein Med (substrate-binding protein (PBP1-ABC) superfamily)